MPQKLKRYYVLHLGLDAPSRHKGFVFEVQAIDDVGQATAWVHLKHDQRRAEIDGTPVPHAVIEAAHRMGTGTGDFVDENGEQVLPVDL